MRLRRLSGDAMQLRRSAAAAEGSQWKSEQDATARECDGAGRGDCAEVRRRGRRRLRESDGAGRGCDCAMRRRVCSSVTGFAKRSRNLSARGACLQGQALCGAVGAGQRLVLLCCGEHGVRLARVVVIQCVGARTRNH